MQKKFLRAFAILIFFLGILVPIGIENVYGMYTDVFEREMGFISCSNMICKSMSRGSGTVYGKKTVSVEVGQSYGPHGVTRHYADKEVPTSSSWHLGYKCRNCGKSLGDESWVQVPKVYIRNSGSTRPTLTVDESWNDNVRPLCGRPQLDGEIKKIWDHAKMPTDGALRLHEGLERLWKAARELDDEKKKEGIVSGSSTETTPLNSVEYVVERQGPCCCCTIA